MRRGALVALALVAVGSAGCYPDPVVLEIQFPNELSFLYTEVADVAVFELGPDEAGACPELVSRVREDVGSREPAFALRAPACDLPGGGVSLDDVGEGLRGFVVVARDGSPSSNPLMHGCSAVEVWPGRNEVPITLQPTADYLRLVEQIGVLECANVEEKCRNGC